MVYAKNQTLIKNQDIFNLDKLDKMVHENQDDFNISNFITFLLIVFIGLLISLIVLLVYYCGKSRDDHGGKNNYIICLIFKYQFKLF